MMKTESISAQNRESLRRFAAASSVSSALFPSANFSATNSPSSAWCW